MDLFPLGPDMKVWFNIPVTSQLPALEITNSQFPGEHARHLNNLNIILVYLRIFRVNALMLLCSQINILIFPSLIICEVGNINRTYYILIKLDS